MLEFSHKCLEYAICMMCVIWQQVPESFTISLYSCELAQLSFKLQCGLIIWITKGNETKRNVLFIICSIHHTFSRCMICSIYHQFYVQFVLFSVLSSVLYIICSIYHLFYVPFVLYLSSVLSIPILCVIRSIYHLFYLLSILWIICLFIICSIIYTGYN